MLLTVGMRLVLFPVFVKQIRNQRAMQVLQPKMKELQAKYKNDKEKLNQEMMALWKENGANPLSGCLPLLLQIPIFISLFHTLREIKPSHATAASRQRPDLLPEQHPGLLPARDLQRGARQDLRRPDLGVVQDQQRRCFHALGGSQGSTRALCLILTVLMGATTFITQRQLMAQNNASGATAQMAQQQKILLYVFPLMFLFYGFTSRSACCSTG